MDDEMGFLQTRPVGQHESTKDGRVLTDGEKLGPLLVINEILGVDVGVKIGSEGDVDDAAVLLIDLDL